MERLSREDIQLWKFGMMIRFPQLRNLEENSASTECRKVTDVGNAADSQKPEQCKLETIADRKITRCTELAEKNGYCQYHYEFVNQKTWPR